MKTKKDVEKTISETKQSQHNEQQIHKYHQEIWQIKIRVLT